MQKKTVIIIVIVLVVLCLCCVLVAGAAGYFIYSTTQPAVEVGESFLDSLKHEQYPDAFQLLTPNTRKDIGDPAKLKNIVTQEDLIPAEWNVTSRNVDNDTASMGGKLTTSSGAEIQYLIEFHQINDRWLISYYGPAD